MTDDHLRAICNAVAHLSGAMQAAGIMPGQWRVELRDRATAEIFERAMRPRDYLPRTTGEPPFEPGTVALVAGVHFFRKLR